MPSRYIPTCRDSSTHRRRYPQLNFNVSVYLHRPAPTTRARESAPFGLLAPAAVTVSSPVTPHLLHCGSLSPSLHGVCVTVSLPELRSWTFPLCHRQCYLPVHAFTPGLFDRGILQIQTVPFPGLFRVYSILLLAGPPGSNMSTERPSLRPVSRILSGSNHQSHTRAFIIPQRHRLHLLSSHHRPAGLVHGRVLSSPRPPPPVLRESSRMRPPLSTLCSRVPLIWGHALHVLHASRDGTPNILCKPAVVVLHLISITVHIDDARIRLWSASAHLPPQHDYAPHTATAGPLSRAPDLERTDRSPAARSIPHRHVQEQPSSPATLSSAASPQVHIGLAPSLIINRSSFRCSPNLDCSLRHLTSSSTMLSFPPGL